MKKIIKITMLLCLILFTATIKLFALPPELRLNLVYPSDNTKITAHKTFFIGSTDPEASLTINGNKTKVYKNGSFVKVLDLKSGKNNILLKSKLDGQTKTLIINVFAPEPQKTLPHKPILIDESSIQPSNDIVYKPGEIINVSFKGSKDYSAGFLLGDKKIIMKEQYSKKLGKTGFYHGKYTVQKTDCFDKIPVSVYLSSKNTRLTKPSKARISTLANNSNILIALLKDKTPVRKTPFGDRLTPLAKGTVLAADKLEQKHYEVILSDSKRIWINQDDVQILGLSPEKNNPFINELNISENDESVYITASLTEKAPVQISESGNSLAIDIYGNSKEICDYCIIKPDFLNTINISSPSNNILSIKTSVKASKLSGYDYFYRDNKLYIKIDKPPVNCPENILKGKIIAIDPGHGGSESGSTGPTGVPEKTINLAISDYLKQLLEEEGATVIMTRVNDDENPDLFERPEIAKRNNAHLLVSIHNNALPDGKNPYKEHGTSTYYYHPQAIPLAKAVQAELSKATKFVDMGIFNRSFVLTRPTDPVSILVEVGFMINPFEYEQLLQPDFQKQSATGIKEGIKRYFSE